MTDLIRKSDSHLLQYLHENSHQLNLYQQKVNITEKMDGSQMRVCFRYDSKKPMLVGVYSRNGGVLFDTQSFYFRDLQYTCYQKVPVGQYLVSHLSNFQKLVVNLKKNDPQSIFFNIFVEVMIPVSPLKINYSEDKKNNLYIFQVDSEQKSIRMDSSLSDMISGVGLTPVPFLGTFTFDLECLDTLENLMKKRDIEGYILEFVDLAVSFKLKYGKFDVSRIANKVDPQLFEPEFYRPLVERLQLISRTYSQGEVEDTIRGLIMKEITHSDWSQRYQQREGLREKKNLTYGLFDRINLKYSKDNYELVNSKKFKSYFYKHIDSLLSS